MKNKKIVFFDGVCNFCNKSVNFIWIRNSKRNIYYASLQSRFAKNRLFKLGVDLKLDTIYFYDGNKLLKKSRAVFKILEDLKLETIFSKFRSSDEKVNIDESRKILEELIFMVDNN